MLKWKHSEHQRRENTFSVLRFLKAASLFVFFSEDSMWICSALFDLCLVSLHNKLRCIKPFIFSVVIRYMQHSQQPRIITRCDENEGWLKFFRIDKWAVFFFQGKSIQMVFLPPTRWFSSSVSFPTPARMRLIYGRYQIRTTTLRSGSPLTVSTIFIFLVSCVCVHAVSLVVSAETETLKWVPDFRVAVIYSSNSSEMHNQPI